MRITGTGPVRPMEYDREYLVSCVASRPSLPVKLIHYRSSSAKWSATAHPASQEPCYGPFFSCLVHRENRSNQTSLLFVVLSIHSK